MYQQHPMRPQTSIHGHLLELTVVGCKFPDNATKDVYLHLEYGDVRRTTSIVGQNCEEKIVIKLMEGQQHIQAEVRRKRTIKVDTFIGSTKVGLEQVLKECHHDSWWPFVCKAGKHTCDVRLILFYKDAINNIIRQLSPAPPPPAYYHRQPPSHMNYQPYPRVGDQRAPHEHAYAYSQYQYSYDYQPPYCPSPQPLFQLPFDVNPAPAPNSSAAPPQQPVINQPWQVYPPPPPSSPTAPVQPPDQQSSFYPDLHHHDQEAYSSRLRGDLGSDADQKAAREQFSRKFSSKDPPQVPNYDLDSTMGGQQAREQLSTRNSVNPWRLYRDQLDSDGQQARDQEIRETIFFDKKGGASKYSPSSLC